MNEEKNGLDVHAILQIQWKFRMDKFFHNLVSKYEKINNEIC